MARILVAEDEETVRELVTRALTQDGHEVEAVPDGAAALEKLAAAEPFELLLSDIRMPVMDGIALALSAARDFPQVAIILMTGYAGERDRALGIDQLVHDIVLKPFSLSDLKQRLRDALAARTERLAPA
jgi:two-component system, cell cycle response regulator CpdR